MKKKSCWARYCDTVRQIGDAFSVGCVYICSKVLAAMWRCAGCFKFVFIIQMRLFNPVTYAMIDGLLCNG
jgi:hypothetical protein